MKKIICIVLILATFCMCLVGCTTSNNASIKKDERKTVQAANTLQENQPTPTDIDYSLERYNLIRRAYWVNGNREKANSLPCEVEKPLGYIVLFSGNAVVGNFVVDGKVSSLNSFLTPNYQYFSSNDSNYSLEVPRELADIDGSYGENDGGIFFFTPDGKYIEWRGNCVIKNLLENFDAAYLSNSKFSEDMVSLYLKK